MNSDAARFQRQLQTGKFLPVTAYFGVESAQAVLAEDAVFPSTKAELVEDQGWKVIDLTAEKRIHLSGVLGKIPERTYLRLAEVVEALKAVI